MVLACLSIASIYCTDNKESPEEKIINAPNERSSNEKPEITNGGDKAIVDNYSFPKKDWSKIANPLASEDAVVGGKLIVFSGQSPKSLNYYLDQNTTNSELFDIMFDSLMNTHPVTLEKIPGIANKWSISKDKMTFKLTIDPKAKWSDGKPITSQDVQFTWDCVMDKKNITGPFKVSFGKMQRPEIIDDKNFIIRGKEVHWKLLNIIADFHILPKHHFVGKKFNNIDFEFPVTSGTYKIKEFKENLYLDMERRSDYWMRFSKFTKGTGNFKTIRYKFFSDRGNAYESFIKGEIDLFAVYMSKRWIKDAVGNKFDKNWIVKQKVYNYDPIGFQGFSMNMRNNLFKDKRVRKALAHLLNRERMNTDLMFKQYAMTHSYFPDMYNKEIPCKNRVIKFDVEAAKKLLKEAGWKAEEDGILAKDGKKFIFNFLLRSKSSQKFLDIYIDDLKKVGIKINIIQKDWAGWVKDMDQYNFDITWSSWSAGVFKDPENMWFSKHAKTKGGFNITGFKNAKVDALIEKQKSIFNVTERNKIVRQVDAILTQEIPYALLWHNNYTRLLYWNKFGVPDTVLNKYSDERSARSYWWFEEDNNEDLKQAIKKNKSLPRYDATIKFDEKYSGK